MRERKCGEFCPLVTDAFAEETVKRAFRREVKKFNPYRNQDLTPDEIKQKREELRHIIECYKSLTNGGSSTFQGQSTKIGETNLGFRAQKEYEYKSPGVYIEEF